MKRVVLTIFVVAMLARSTSATLIVHDPIHTLMNEGNWLITEIKQGLQYAKQLEQYIAEHTTALKEVQQVENEIVQLERMGDPKAFGANLPGVQVSIPSLTEKDLADLHFGLNTGVDIFANPAIEAAAACGLRST
jgi:hypothetical protein